MILGKLNGKVDKAYSWYYSKNMIEHSVGFHYVLELLLKQLIEMKDLALSLKLLINL